jgi:ferredoxin
MALKITDECINCNACEPECPNNAIYENAAKWNFAKGTSLTSIELEDGSVIDAAQWNAPINEKVFYIVPDKCTECKGFHEEPQCAAVCPVDCCVLDPENEEAEETLLAKKAWLHGEVAA